MLFSLIGPSLLRGLIGPLSSNQISAIENLSRLTVLRVLNLSSNFVTKVGNLEGLESLVELNLRKNRVKSAVGAPHFRDFFISPGRSNNDKESEYS